MLYLIYQVDKRNSEALRAKVRESHLAYLEQHKDILVLGGATLSDDGAQKTGSVLLINVRSRAEADAFSENEPFRKSGLFESVAITRMRKGQWNPAAAPATAEGD